MKISPSQSPSKNFGIHNRIFTIGNLVQKNLNIFLGAIFFFLSGQISLPYGEVPITSQTLVLFLGSIYLKPKDFLMAGLLWITAGAMGYPTFSFFRAGVGVLLSPTGGFIWGMLMMGFFSSWITKKGRTAQSRFLSLFTAAVLFFPGVLCFGALQWGWIVQDFWGMLTKVFGLFGGIEMGKALVALLISSKGTPRSFKHLNDLHR